WYAGAGEPAIDGVAAKAREARRGLRPRALRRGEVIDVQALLSAQSIGWYGPLSAGPLAPSRAEDATTASQRPDTLASSARLHPPGYQAYFEPLSQMGQLLPQAVIAIEDRNFYAEPGIDPQGIARAATVDLKSHRPVEGASTITQQLVKLRLVGNDATLDRKVREALLAFEIERKFTKDEILEWYLNSVFFANTAWGTAAASRIYFHTETKD